MGQTHSAPPDEAVQFRKMVLATYRGDVESLRSAFRSELRGLQISRATYLDIIMQEQTHLETLTDSLEREEQLNELQDEKMEFFSAVEHGRYPRLYTAHRLPETIKDSGQARYCSQHGDLPGDVTGNNCSLQLLLATVDDVHEVFGSNYREEAKVHRLVRSLRRIWPLWMFEGQQEVAALVRVLYDVRTSDPAFGGLVRVAMAIAEHFRVAVSRDGIRLAMSLLVECDGDLHQARQVLTKEWSVERKFQELTTILWRWFPLYKSNGRRKDREEEEARAVFFDSAMTTWLQIAQDQRLFGGKGGNSNVGHIEVPGAAALKRYDPQKWFFIRKLHYLANKKKVKRRLAMSRRGYRSTSLFPPRGPAKSPVRQRVCNSAPTEVIPDQEEDWDWGLVQEEDDNTVMQRDQEEGDAMRIIEEMEIRAVSEEHPTKNTGDFTDFMDSDSSDSDNGPLDDSSSDEPYEYWTKQKSYSHSPFSNCSSFSFEDSDGDEDSTSTTDSHASAQSTQVSTIPPTKPTTKISRYSDLGPSVKHGWTARIHGEETFLGPTSI
ncbi:hypothetical protein PC114_g9574 [Phytophthora cactorum]|uniref:Uncharacterized protein n=1 Tax=Phytophthora cactorum TaxID=29920 RepID=A0A8T1CRK7_9STRA|nr:hypothetical protein PC112_g8495 [Phytophthora cactorum]KAG2910963.1 hypothetical protein PC114_g9574 [Phytophthora cactorum]KAG2925626.1 hypothetical protein PC115_g8185 [Phytophthora cactorum]KAG2943288.1 hypothetical protein PC117_g9483 [Phytophthora cactorum]KAG3087899.1 hypothetical protein PC122_g8625 [Phytophthora cactorum]